MFSLPLVCFVQPLFSCKDIVFVIFVLIVIITLNELLCFGIDRTVAKNIPLHITYIIKTKLRIRKLGGA